MIFCLRQSRMARRIALRPAAGWTTIAMISWISMSATGHRAGRGLRAPGNSPPAFLLREGYREDGKVKTRSLANLSKLPPDAIAALAAVLKGESLVKASQAFEAVVSFRHGHVEAVLDAMGRLGFAKLIASRPSRERNLVVVMVVARILEPDSKLATTRSWHLTTLPALLDVYA